MFRSHPVTLSTRAVPFQKHVATTRPAESTHDSIDGILLTADGKALYNSLHDNKAVMIWPKLSLKFLVN